MSTVRINQLQVLPVAKKPDYLLTIMGHLPLYGLTADNVEKRIEESIQASEGNLIQRLTRLIYSEERSKSVVSTHRQNIVVDNENEIMQ